MFGELKEVKYIKKIIYFKSYNVKEIKCLKSL